SRPVLVARVHGYGRRRERGGGTAERGDDPPRAVRPSDGALFGGGDRGGRDERSWSIRVACGRAGARKRHHDPHLAGRGDRVRNRYGSRDRPHGGAAGSWAPEVSVR